MSSPPPRRQVLLPRAPEKGRRKFAKRLRGQNRSLVPGAASNARDNSFPQYSFGIYHGSMSANLKIYFRCARLRLK